MNGALFFTTLDGGGGYLLWKSDGTAAGTVAVKGFGPGPTNLSELTDLTDVNGTLFFWNYDEANGAGSSPPKMGYTGGSSGGATARPTEP